MTKIQKRRLSAGLTAIFLLALIMGPGPGNGLVRSPSGEGPAQLLGVPLLYAWTVFWFLVMASVVVTAAAYLWSDQDPPRK